MSYEVRVIEVVARPTVVARARTTWGEFPSVWNGLLDEVWTCVRAAGIERGCRDVMLYLDDVPNVEVGVELAEPIAVSGRVIASNLLTTPGRTQPPRQATRASTMPDAGIRTRRH